MAKTEVEQQKKRAPRAPAGPERKEPRSEAMEWIKSIGIALVLFVLIRTFLIQAFTIPSGSMERTLLVGDYLMANNVTFGARVPFTDWRVPSVRDPRRGEIVVFRPTYNDPVIDVVKRVVALPGDTVRMDGGAVSINGRRLDEPYARDDGVPDRPLPAYGGVEQRMQGIDPERFGYHWHLDALAPGVDRASYAPTRENWGPLVVPEGRYLLLGDNRDHSLDSRYLGFIPRRQIVGKPMFIYFSYDKLRPAPFPRPLTTARWGRIGMPVR